MIRLQETFRFRSVRIGGVAVFLASALLCAGCQPTSMDRHFAPIAVWYRVDAEGQAMPTDAADDLSTIRDLGFNTVLLDGLGEAKRKTIDELAEAHGLIVVAADADAQAYVATGRLPLECWLPRALAWRTQWRAERIVSFGGITDAASGERARILATLHHERAEAPATFVAIAANGDVAAGDVAATFSGKLPEGAEDDAGTPVGNLANISVRQPSGHRDAAADGWLSAFHRALASGQTSGVVVDRFRSMTPDWDAVVDSHGAVSVRRASALKQITTRARKWCPRLRGTTTKPIESSGTNDLPIEVVLFNGGKRPFVMVWNSSTTRFVRESFPLSVQFGGRRASRLVAVPADDSTAVGEVLSVRRGRVTMPTNLAPGDARLYEVF